MATFFVSADPTGSWSNWVNFTHAFHSTNCTWLLPCGMFTETPTLDQGRGGACVSIHRAIRSTRIFTGVWGSFFRCNSPNRMKDRKRYGEHIGGYKDNLVEFFKWSKTRQNEGGGHSILAMIDERVQGQLDRLFQEIGSKRSFDSDDVQWLGARETWFVKHSKRSKARCWDHFPLVMCHELAQGQHPSARLTFYSVWEVELS